MLDLTEVISKKRVLVTEKILFPKPQSECFLYRG